MPNTAGEKLRVVIDKFMDFRQNQKARLENDPNLTIGDVTSVNLTVIKVSILLPRVFPLISCLSSSCSHGVKLLTLVVAVLLRNCHERVVQTYPTP